jgi:hypothetical protein
MTNVRRSAGHSHLESVATTLKNLGTTIEIERGSRIVPCETQPLIIRTSGYWIRKDPPLFCCCAEFFPLLQNNPQLGSLQQQFDHIYVLMPVE